jgi:hypothetical protein
MRALSTKADEFTASLGLAAVLAHLLLAPLTLLLAAALHVTGRLTGRLTGRSAGWLAVPAAAGLAWSLALGPRAALAGFTAGPHQVLGYLAAAPAHPGHLAHLGRAFAGVSRWLPRQAPVALLAATAETALAGMVRAGHRPARRGSPAARPGPLAAARWQFTVRAVRSGGVTGRAGGVLGADGRTGRVVEISWAAAGGGVLLAGDGPVLAAAVQLVHAAIRRRKPVVVADLAGTPGLAQSLAAACAAAAAPLRVFGPTGPGCYDPLRGAAPAQQAALVMGMIDWTASTDRVQRACASLLNDLFAVLAAAAPGPPVPVLDEVVALLQPAGLRARAAQVPPYHPDRERLAERARSAASRLAADPAAAAFLAGQLTGLRSAPLGRWLRPALPGPGAVAGISLDAVIRDRAVGLFPLDAARSGRAAQMIAHAVALDLRARYAAAQRQGLPGDGLAVFTRADLVAGPVLSGLLDVGRRAGLATVLALEGGPAAERLAELVNVRVDLAADGQFSVLSRDRELAVPHAQLVLAGRP